MCLCEPMLHVCVSKEAKVGVRFLEVHAVLAQPDMGAGDEAAVHIPDCGAAAPAQQWDFSNCYP